MAFLSVTAPHTMLDLTGPHGDTISSDATVGADNTIYPVGQNRRESIQNLGA